MDDNHVLSTWNDFCAKVPEEKLQKVMGAGKENSWADSICWSIRARRYWDIRNSSQHYWKTSETAMGCTSAAFTYQKYIKIYENLSQLGWSQCVIKDFCFSQPRLAAELAPCGRASRLLVRDRWALWTGDNSNKWQDMMWHYESVVDS